MQISGSKYRSIQLILVFFVLLIVCSSLIILMFHEVIRKYERTTAYESAGHLVEICSQIKLNFEKTITDDRYLTESLADDIKTFPFSGEKELFGYLKKKQQMWGVKDIYVYNYAGLCVDENDTAKNLDVSSGLAYQILKKGKTFNIEESVAEHSISIKSNILVRGQPAVALAVVRDMTTVLRDMNLFSFSGQSSIYLTRQNGVKITQTDNGLSRKVFNITALFEHGRLENISKPSLSLEIAMNVGMLSVFLYHHGKGESDYIIMTPIQAVDETWLLFYIVPHSVVNKAVRGYTRNLSIFMILSIFGVGSILYMFFIVYMYSLRKYNSKLESREEDLRRALVLADSANRAKTQFLSNMSHDIRTPMNAIINMTRFTVENYDNKEKAMGFLKIIQESSDHLLKLINDVLDMSRIESGKLSFSSDPFNLDDDMQMVCEIIKPLCESKKQQFHYTLTSINHSNLKGDTTRFNRIIINLLNNAVKFTPENGNIYLTVSELPSLSTENASFRFEVRDTGIGISKEDIKRIFEPFTRADNDTVQAIEGSGLGLSISKRLVEAMGGSISVTSVLGKGSMFSVELYFPVNIVSDGKKKSSKREEVSFDGQTALLAEDNAINREIASIMLQKLGFTVEIACDGTEAVRMFSESALYHFDVIYMDIRMQPMNGYAAAETIRKLKRQDAKDIPIIAMTANVFSDDVEKARKAGMTAHIAKPIDPDVLHSVTVSAILKRPQRGTVI